MSTTIRPEVSTRNQYWIERHRYYELKHFCMQYKTWKKAISNLDGYFGHDGTPRNPGDYKSDPTAAVAEKREWFRKRIDMVDRAALTADEIIGGFILKGVTEGLSYDVLNTRYNIPCCKDTYYELYRKFFWLLDRARD